MKTIYIDYTKEQLFSVKTSTRSLKKWLMPLAITNKTVGGINSVIVSAQILKLFDKARKLRPLLTP